MRFHSLVLAGFCLVVSHSKKKLEEETVKPADRRKNASASSGELGENSKRNSPTSLKEGVCLLKKHTGAAATNLLQTRVVPGKSFPPTDHADEMGPVGAEEQTRRAHQWETVADEVPEHALEQPPSGQGRAGKKGDGNPWPPPSGGGGQRGVQR